MGRFSRLNSWKFPDKSFDVASDIGTNGKLFGFLLVRLRIFRYTIVVLFRIGFAYIYGIHFWMTSNLWVFFLIAFFYYEIMAFKNVVNIICWIRAFCIYSLCNISSLIFFVSENFIVFSLSLSFPPYLYLRANLHTI